MSKLIKALKLKRVKLDKEIKRLEEREAQAQLVKFNSLLAKGPCYAVLPKNEESNKRARKRILNYWPSAADPGYAKYILIPDPNCKNDGGYTCTDCIYRRYLFDNRLPSELDLFCFAGRMCDGCDKYKPFRKIPIKEMMKGFEKK